MAGKINWDYIKEWKKKEEFKTVFIPYGLPEVLDPEHTKYGIDVEVQPKWNISKKIFICSTIVGAFYSKRGNPNQLITPDEIRDSALAVLEAGAPNVHIHVRDKNGYNVLDPDLFHYVVDPIREKYPDRIICGCLVPCRNGEWQKMIKVLEDGLFDQTPVNTTACYAGDTLLANPPHLVIEKTRIIQEFGVKPQIAVYSDGDVDNADRYLIKTGLLKQPYYWIVLPTLPGGSPMHNPKAMVEVLMNYVNRIRDIDEREKVEKPSQIVVCASGRASSYLATLAILLGLNIRTGMEDTVWMWPHRDEKIKNNAEHFKMFKQLIELLGREIISAQEWRKIMGMRKSS